MDCGSVRCFAQVVRNFDFHDAFLKLQCEDGEWLVGYQLMVASVFHIRWIKFASSTNASNLLINILAVV